ncbi:histidine kinase [Kribbella solani]|uniref:sensor histidine kinase n=1 Tax=Kribbella solani TaxID=236067 RepID=UPI0029A32EBE|nr:histidine kinase [Kribbella solani]MDX3006586.1 histidine kinase [Kribbella solani]
MWLTIYYGSRTGEQPGLLRFPPLTRSAQLDDVLQPVHTPTWTDVGCNAALNLLITLPVIGRRRWPLACLVVQLVVPLPFGIQLTEAALVALLIGAYSAMVYGRSVLLSMSVLLVAAGTTAVVKPGAWPDLPGWAGAFAILLPVGVFGVAIRAARGRAGASDQRAESLEREQQMVTHLAVLHERSRIARELHDVVSHHVSVMTIQAGAAGKVIDAEPQLARTALSAIEASGRETMSELRHLLGLLTTSPSDDLLHPQPGLNQLEALVDNLRQAGQPVTVRRMPIALSPGPDLTAYRVVQEALTNALRHAPGARTEVNITVEPSGHDSIVHSTLNDGATLLIEVTNDAAPPDRRPDTQTGSGSGSGLIGLAERLRLYGGTLQTKRRHGGGFLLRARLPLNNELEPEDTVT